MTLDICQLVLSPTMLSRRFFSTRLPRTINQLLTSPDISPAAPINVNGWIKSVRRQKNIAFAIINDGSSNHGLQAVFTNAALAKQYVVLWLSRAQLTSYASNTQRLTNGACVRVSGELLDSPGSGQDKELRVNSVEIMGQCDPAVRITFDVCVVRSPHESHT